MQNENRVSVGEVLHCSLWKKSDSCVSLGFSHLLVHFVVAKSHLNICSNNQRINFLLIHPVYWMNTRWTRAKTSWTTEKSFSHPPLRCVWVRRQHCFVVAAFSVPTTVKLMPNDVDQSVSPGMRRAPCTLEFKCFSLLLPSEFGSVTQSGSRCLCVPASVSMIFIFFIFFQTLFVTSPFKDSPLHRHTDSAIVRNELVCVHSFKTGFHLFDWHNDAVAREYSATASF